MSGRKSAKIIAQANVTDVSTLVSREHGPETELAAMFPVFLTTGSDVRFHECNPVTVQRPWCDACV